MNVLFDPPKDGLCFYHALLKKGFPPSNTDKRNAYLNKIHSCYSRSSSNQTNKRKVYATEFRSLVHDNVVQEVRKRLLMWDKREKSDKDTILLLTKFMLRVYMNKNQSVKRCSFDCWLEAIRWYKEQSTVLDSSRSTCFAHALEIETAAKMLGVTIVVTEPHLQGKKRTTPGNYFVKEYNPGNKHKVFMLLEGKHFKVVNQREVFMLLDAVNQKEDVNSSAVNLTWNS
jgi:hypothetical protein